MIDPLFGPSTGVVFTVNGVPSGSLSPVSVKSPPTGVSSFVVIFSLSTTGASFTGLTVMKIVSFTQLIPGVPASQTLTITVSKPLKFEFGVYVYVPSAFTTIVPLFGPSTGVVFTVNGVPSGSLSPESVTSPEPGVSSFVTSASLSITGASFTGLTVTVKLALFDVAPALSLIVYWIVAVPLKFEAGVNVTSPVVVFTPQVPCALENVVC